SREINAAKIRPLARLQRADLALEPEGAGASKGGGVQRIPGSGEQSHDFHIAPDVLTRRGARAADPKPRVRGAECGDGRQALAQFEIALRAQGDRNAGALL